MASPIALPESSSSSPNLNLIYDVFLSFRGEDTRSNFTSHLDMALRQKGLNFFIDDKLERGDQISESLLKSIEASRISIIIFSQNYASSSWCLDELVKIIECMTSKGQIVLPVFYKVDPSEIRKKTGGFGEALAKHEAKFPNAKIKTWKEALTTVAGLSGWDLGTRKEADLIEDLVKEVLSKVNRKQLLQVAKHPVGIDSQLEAILELGTHDVSDDGVFMVGIYGLGGIGKTTLAKALYNIIANQFEGLSFLSDVREASSCNGGLVQLQEMLLYDILKDDLKVGNVHKGMNIIRDRLCSKKVLIVLDDVDKLDQLEKLVGERDWFGGGSKIIVTTRNKHLLSSHGFDQMHDIQGLDEDKALELFSWHAFKESHPSSNYLELSQRATSYCKGLPLALVVLGSLLCKREQTTWKSQLDELENSLEPGIEAVFQISFKGLQDKVKEIFLDISCIFLGEGVNSPFKDMLKACDLNPDYGITILMDLSLLTIDRYGRFEMHDLIRQMGQTIVHRESSEPEKRSRLWMKEEIINMLKENSGTNAVKAIKLDLLNDHVRKGVLIDPKAFKNMKNLRLLIIQGAKFCTSIFEYLPNKLRWIESSSCTIGFLQPLPVPISLNDQLVGLHFTHNKDVIHLGSRFENCERLKCVDLSYCTVLEEIPDFSAALNLEKLYVRSCHNLKMIDESVGSLSKLITLDLENCVNLEKLPCYLRLTSLEVLNLQNCRHLKEIPDLSAASSLKELYLRGCFKLRIIHNESSSRSLDKLVTLNLEGCPNLERLPSYVRVSECLEYLNLSYCQKLEELISYFSLEMFSNQQRKFKYLKVLDLCCCRNLEEFDFSIASNLEILKLHGCINLRKIHESIGSLDKLVYLDLSNCDNLLMLPNFSGALNLVKLFLGGCQNLRTVHESIGSLHKLVFLNLEGCSNLEKLPSYLRLKSLDSLILNGCKKLEQFPEFDENMKSLRVMKLDFTAIKELPRSVKHLTGLQNLTLRRCVNLIALPSEIHLLESLQELDLHGCSKFDMFFQITLTSIFFHDSLCSKLTELNLADCNISNADFLKSLSNVCTSLTDLNLSGNKFCCLPSLHNLTSLRYLYLRKCKFLENITNLPQWLDKMDASGSELLVISPDYIADTIFKKQDFGFHGSREFRLTNSEIPISLINKMTESSTSVVSIQHKLSTPYFEEQALVVCVVFKVDESDSSKLGGEGGRLDFHRFHPPQQKKNEGTTVSYEILMDGEIYKSVYGNFCWSKSEHMWLIITPLRFRSSDVNVPHNIQGSFKIGRFSQNTSIATIRRHGMFVLNVLGTDQEHQIGNRKRNRSESDAEFEDFFRQKIASFV